MEKVKFVLHVIFYLSGYSFKKSFLFPALYLPYTHIFVKHYMQVQLKCGKCNLETSVGWNHFFFLWQVGQSDVLPLPELQLSELQGQ